jgi:hypothetical protein
MGENSPNLVTLVLLFKHNLLMQLFLQVDWSLFSFSIKSLIVLKKIYFQYFRSNKIYDSGGIQRHPLDPSSKKLSFLNLCAASISHSKRQKVHTTSALY